MSETNTDQVRLDFAYLGGYSRESEYDYRVGEFNRWLDRIRSEAWLEGRNAQPDKFARNPYWTTPSTR